MELRDVYDVNKIKTGETYEKGIHTEVLEELGIDIPKEEFKYKETLKTPHGFMDIYYLKMDINISDLVLQTSEVARVRWVSKKELEKMIAKNNFQVNHSKAYKLIQDKI